MESPPNLVIGTVDKFAMLALPLSSGASPASFRMLIFNGCLDPSLRLTMNYNLPTEKDLVFVREEEKG